MLLLVIAALAGSQPIGGACAITGDCVAGATCVDQVCCESDCDVADPTRCTACSVATGATADGTCTIIGGRLCRPAAGPCDLPETCDGVRAACPYDQAMEEGLPCPGGLCFETVCIATGPDAGTAAPGGDDSCDAGAGGAGIAIAALVMLLALRNRTGT